MVGSGETNEVGVVVESKRRCWMIVMWIIVKDWKGELEWWCLNENKVRCVSEAGGVVITGIVGELWWRRRWWWKWQFGCGAQIQTRLWHAYAN